MSELTGILLPDIVQRLVGDASGLVGELGKANEEVNKFAASSDSKMQTLMKGVQKYGAAIGAALTGAGYQMVEFGAKFEQSEILLKQSIENNGGTWEKYAAQIEEVDAKMAHYGYTSDESMTAMNRLVQATHDPTKALDEMQLVADLAAQRHWSLAEAATQVARALSGSPRLFKQYGINVGDMTKATKEAEKAQRDAAKAQGTLQTAQQKYNNALDLWNSTTKHTVSEHQRLIALYQQAQTATQNYRLAQEKAAITGSKVQDTQQQILTALQQLVTATKGSADAVSSTFDGWLGGLKASVENFFGPIAAQWGPWITGIGAVTTVTSGLIDVYHTGAEILKAFRERSEQAREAQKALATAEADQALAADAATTALGREALAEEAAGGAATGAAGKIRGMSGALKGVGVAGAALAVGIPLVGDLVGAIGDKMFGVVPKAEQLHDSIISIANGADANKIANFGGKLHGVGQELEHLTNPGTSQRVEDFFGKLAGQGGGEGRNRVLENLAAIDQEMQNLIASGHADIARKALAAFTKAGLDAGATQATIDEQFAGTEAALKDLSDSTNSTTKDFVAMYETMSSVVQVLIAMQTQARLTAAQLHDLANEDARRVGSHGGSAADVAAARQPWVDAGVLPDPNAAVPSFDPTATDAAAKARAAKAARDAAAAKALAEQKAALASVTTQLQAAVDRAKNLLQSLRDAASQMAKAVADSIKNYANITNALPDRYAKTGDNYIMVMRERMNKIKTFYANIKKLQKEHLNPTTLQEIINAGPEAGGDIAAMLANNQSEVNQINTLQAGINAAANSIGTVSANIEYAEQIKVAKAHLATSEAMLALWKKTLAADNGGVHIHVAGSVLSESQLWALVQKYANTYYRRNGRAGV